MNAAFSRQSHREDERLVHYHRGIRSFQGIRDKGCTRFVLYRSDVGRPENRSDVDEEGGISHTPPKTNPAVKGRDYKTSGIDRTGTITWVQIPVRENIV